MMENHALHLVARALVRVRPVPRAKRILDVIAGLLRPVESDEEARRIAAQFGSRGSCLTRALTVAARVPRAEVVIGAEPRLAALALREEAKFYAHAWVERDGEVLVQGDEAAREILRLR